MHFTRQHSMRWWSDWKLVGTITIGSRSWNSVWSPGLKNPCQGKHVVLIYQCQRSHRLGDVTMSQLAFLMESSLHFPGKYPKPSEISQARTHSIPKAIPSRTNLCLFCFEGDPQQRCMLAWKHRKCTDVSICWLWMAFLSVLVQQKNLLLRVQSRCLLFTNKEQEKVGSWCNAHSCHPDQLRSWHRCSQNGSTNGHVFATF